MKLIKELVEKIHEELEDAKEYAEEAVMYKMEYPELAKTFYDLSTDEMRHMNMLHTEATRIIEDYRKKNGAPPEAMMAVYNYMHDKQIKKAHEVKIFWDEYKER